MFSRNQAAFRCFPVPALALLLALNAHASTDCRQALGGGTPALAWSTKAEALGNTPKFFAKIPWPSSKPITKHEAVEKYAQRYGKRMTAEEAQAIVAYLGNPAVSRDPMSATTLLQARLGADNPAFDILTNVSAGIQALMEYDSKHGTDHAAETGNEIIRKLLPNPGADDYPDLFKDVSLAAMASKNPKAIAGYIAAVSESPASDGFVRDKDDNLNLGDLLEPLQKLGPEAQPDPSQIMNLLIKKFRYANSLPDPGKNARRYHLEIEVAEVAIYFQYRYTVTPTREALAWAKEALALGKP